MTPIEKMRAVMAEKKARKLAAIEKRKATIASKQINAANTVIDLHSQPECTHECNTHYGTICCECADLRPHDPTGYIAYNNSYLTDMSIVSRDYYYCRECKERLKTDYTNVS